MGRPTTRKFKCRCSVCYNRFSLERSINQDLSIRAKWEDVDVLTSHGINVYLICNNCGHTWTSQSKAAHRLAESKVGKYE